jgi:hypothetical protein
MQKTRLEAIATDGFRRRHLLAGASGFALLGLGGCAVSRVKPARWEMRLRGRTVALLGETHDNAQLHGLRLNALRRALQAG